MQFSAAGETFKLKYVKDALKDVKTYFAMGYVMCVRYLGHKQFIICPRIYMGFDGPLFAFSLFTPTIINELGYKATAANLLSVPVYAWGKI
jgi:hypothetical protein